MGAATQERSETDEERTERENREQAERLAAEKQDALDQGAEFDDADRVADGQTGATRVDAPPEELLVAGTTQLGLFDAGGKKPTGATITIQGLGSIPVMAGQGYEKGQLVRGEFVATVEAVNLKDKVDRKAGVAVDCKQIHTAYATDVRIYNATSPRLPDEAGLAERVQTAIELLQSGEPDVGTVVQLLEQGLGA